MADSGADAAAQGDGEHSRRGAANRLALRLANSPEIGIIVAVIVAFVVFTIINPLFASVSDLQSPLGPDLAGFGILAVGESFAIITGGIDLSVVSLTAFFCVASAWLNVSAILFVFASGLLAHSAGLTAESMRTIP